MDKEAINDIKEFRPILRSVLAFIIYLRWDNVHVKGSYDDADQFLDNLEADINA